MPGWRSSVYSLCGQRGKNFCWAFPDRIHPPANHLSVCLLFLGSCDKNQEDQERRAHVRRLLQTISSPTKLVAWNLCSVNCAHVTFYFAQLKEGVQNYFVDLVRRGDRESLLETVYQKCSQKGLMMVFCTKTKGDWCWGGGYQPVLQIVKRDNHGWGTTDILDTFVFCWIYRILRIFGGDQRDPSKGSKVYSSQRYSW